MQIFVLYNNLSNLETYLRVINGRRVHRTSKQALAETKKIIIRIDKFLEKTEFTESFTSVT